MAKKRKKKTKEELARARRNRIFKSKIRTTFTSAGFLRLKTENKHNKIGNRVIEIDEVFVYKNIMLICEDTGTTANSIEHILKTQETFDTIKNYFSEFLSWLCATFPEHEAQLREYQLERYRTFNLYFTQNELPEIKEKRKRFSEIIFVEPQTLNYFHRISTCIKLTARFEIFRFLEIECKDVGPSKTDLDMKTITAPIICPKDSIGISDGIRVVSFMMSADLLLKTSYVMRKDSWEKSNWPYQRLIEKDKITKIRRFLVKSGETFYNNIIVGLPSTVRFKNESGDFVSIEKIGDLENCKLVINEEWNSICVIDGQHRIFAHYMGPENDKLEPKVAPLRQKLHLLVTGLIFPPDMSLISVAEIQSRLFLEINSNAKSVPADVLLHIKMISNPFSDIGLARRVIEQLNKKDIFRNQFELSTISKSKIKVASIIKFALRYLVTITPTEGKKSFFSYWDEDKITSLQNKEVRALNEYIEFCTNHLVQYFSAVRNQFKAYWNDETSKILSVISINGFIIAYTRQLAVNELQEFAFYEEHLKNLSVDFSKKSFPYTSSQYRKFSDKIISEAFKLDATKV